MWIKADTKVLKSELPSIPGLGGSGYMITGWTGVDFDRAITTPGTASVVIGEITNGVDVDNLNFMYLTLSDGGKYAFYMDASHITLSNYNSMSKPSTTIAGVDLTGFTGKITESFASQYIVDENLTSEQKKILGAWQLYWYFKFNGEDSSTQSTTYWWVANSASYNRIAIEQRMYDPKNENGSSWNFYKLSDMEEFIARENELPWRYMYGVRDGLNVSNPESSTPPVINLDGTGAASGGCSIFYKKLN